MTTATEQACGDFLRWAIRELVQRKPNRRDHTFDITQDDYNTLEEIFGTSDTSSFESVFNELLEAGALDWEKYPFSIAVAKLKGRKPSPHCVARTHMDPDCFAVWDFATALSAKKGSCWLSTRVTADWTHQAVGTTHRAIKWLIKNEWLLVVKKPSSGRGGRGQYAPVSHEDWISDHGNGYSTDRDAQCRTVADEEEF